MQFTVGFLLTLPSFLHSLKTLAELKTGKRKEIILLKDSYTAGKPSH